ncbi:hypothetical protein C8035_v002439 [Colletotrichum spinosum]|uniref:N-acetyltransferase domain-containing protein n=1 Tax=Colletotrichum spinosum TaxID=1347390 RepID=A0A4R8Q4H2_9PEZI|nr:hypothetical protein C8035_v002439 [Colletotrichum spinosum]
MDIRITPASPDDVQQLVKIHTAAFASDRFSQLMLLNRGPHAHEALMLRSIEEWAANPAAKLYRAVDAQGQVVGWSCWIINEAKEVAPSASTETSATDAKEPDPVETQPPPQDPARVLGGLMFKDRVRFEDEYLRGRRHVVLQGLATDPRYQRRGVGSRLVAHGLEELDTLGLDCWIHASPASYGVYEKAGFREVGKSEFDLDEFAPPGGGWGRYVFRHMIRYARTKGE